MELSPSRWALTLTVILSQLEILQCWQSGWVLGYLERYHGHVWMSNSCWRSHYLVQITQIEKLQFYQQWFSHLFCEEFQLDLHGSGNLFILLIDLNGVCIEFMKLVPNMFISYLLLFIHILRTFALTTNAMFVFILYLYLYLLKSLYLLEFLVVYIFIEVECIYSTCISTVFIDHICIYFFIYFLIFIGLDLIFLYSIHVL